MKKLKSQIKKLETLERVFKCIAYFCLGLMWGLILSNRFTLWAIALILSMTSIILSAICSWKKANREYSLGILELKNKNQYLHIHDTDGSGIRPDELLVRTETSDMEIKPLEVDDIDEIFSEGENENER